LSDYGWLAMFIEIYIVGASAWFMHRLNRFLDRLVSDDDRLMVHFSHWPMFIGLAGAAGLVWSALWWPWYLIDELIKRAEK
jgi:hypothetical protein